MLPGAVVGAISAPLIGGALKAHFPPKLPTITPPMMKSTRRAAPVAAALPIMPIMRTHKLCR